MGLDAQDKLRLEQIERTFTYHAPHGDQASRYEQIRGKAREFALLILQSCPVESREKSVAFTKLQECVMWTNAAIAINETAS